MSCRFNRVVGLPALASAVALVTGCGGKVTGSGDGTAAPAGGSGPGREDASVEPGSNPVRWPTAPPGADCAQYPSASVSGLALAATGEIYLAGGYSGAADFGTGPLPDVGNGSAAFVSKFEANGNPVWSRAFDGYDAWVTVDHAGRPAVAVARLTDSAYEGTGTLRQLDPATGSVRWEYPLTWNAGDYARRIAVTAGEETVVALPGSLTQLDSQGNVVWTHPLSSSSAGASSGDPVELVETDQGNLILYDVDYFTWSPLVVHYRLSAFDAGGRLRWTRRVEAQSTPPALMAADPRGNAAVFGYAYGKVAIEGFEPVMASGGFSYLGILDQAGNVVAQQGFEAKYQSAGTWRNGELVLAEVTYTDSNATELRWSSFSSAGVSLGANSTVVPNLETPALRLGAQGLQLVVAGARDNSSCADCNVCDQPRPFLLRVDATGALDPSFGRLMP